jgi:hypothetical protein
MEKCREQLQKRKREQGRGKKVPSSRLQVEIEDPCQRRSTFDPVVTVHF